MLTAILIVLLQVRSSLSNERTIDVRASYLCRDGGQPCRSGTFSFTNSSAFPASYPITPPLVLRYERTFADQSRCSYYVNHPVHGDFAYISYCQVGQEVITEGLFYGANDVYHVYYNEKRKQQQIMLQSAYSARGLRRAGADDDVIHTGRMDGDRSVTLDIDRRVADFSNPTMELAFNVDGWLVKFCNNDRNAAERFVHHVANGMQAVYQPLNVTIRVTNVMFWDDRLTDSITGSIDSYSTYLNNVRDHYNNFVNTQTDLLRENLPEEAIRGVPDAVISLTDKQLPGNGLVGRAFGKGMCYPEYSYAIIIMPARYWIQWLTFKRMIVSAVAHEVGHLLGLDHENRTRECAGLTDPVRGNGVMFSDTTWFASGRWDACSKAKLKDRLLTGKKEVDCLFTRDVFENRESVVLPETAKVRVGVKWLDKDGAEIKITFRFRSAVTIRLTKSIKANMTHQSGKHGNENECFFYRNLVDEPFAAFEECSTWEVRWYGVFHMHDRRVELYIDGPRTYITRFTHFANATGATDVVKGKGMSLDLLVTVLIGMDQAFIKMAGGVEKAFIHVVRSVNMADTAYRRIGVRIRMIGFHSFNDSDTLIEQAGNFYRRQKSANAILLFSSNEKVTSYHSHHRVCSSDNVALIRHDNDSYRQGAEVAHQIGHLLGLDDESRCLCDTKLGTCVMDASGSTRSMLLSTCTLNDMRRLKDEKCFKKVTKKQASAVVVVLRVIVTMFLVMYMLLIFFAMCKLMDKVPSVTELQGKLRTRMRRGSNGVIDTRI